MCAPCRVCYSCSAAWLSDKSWGEFCRLSDIPSFDGLRQDIAAHPADWQAIYDADLPHRERLPRHWCGMSPFQRLLIIRCIRADKVSLGIQDFIKVSMGEQYLSPPPFDLAGSHADSSVSQPLVFVLSPGSDPMAALLYFADTVKKKVDSISLGQGQVCWP